jgi:acetyl/propionyl-CoA carboxylase alpha subunit
VKTAASPKPAPSGTTTASQSPPLFFPPPEEFTRDGIFVVGTVVARVRREFPGTDGKATRYNLTVAVQTESGLVRAERWSNSPSPTDVPERGDRIVLPIAITYYHGKGGTGCRMTWGSSEVGEEF